MKQLQILDTSVQSRPLQRLHSAPGNEAQHLVIHSYKKIKMILSLRYSTTKYTHKVSDFIVMRLSVSVCVTWAPTKILLWLHCKNIYWEHCSMPGKIEAGWGFQCKQNHDPAVERHHSHAYSGLVLTVASLCCVSRAMMLLFYFMKQVLHDILSAEEIVSW